MYIYIYYVYTYAYVYMLQIIYVCYKLYMYFKQWYDHLLEKHEKQTIYVLIMKHQTSKRSN